MVLFATIVAASCGGESIPATDEDPPAAILNIGGLPGRAGIVDVSAGLDVTLRAQTELSLIGTARDDRGVSRVEIFGKTTSLCNEVAGPHGKMKSATWLKPTVNTLANGLAPDELLVQLEVRVKELTGCSPGYAFDSLTGWFKVLAVNAHGATSTTQAFNIAFP